MCIYKVRKNNRYPLAQRETPTGTESQLTTFGTV